MAKTKIKAKVVDANGKEIPGDAQGNNASFACFDCDYPVIATLAYRTLRGRKDNPAVCKNCDAKYFMETEKKGAAKLFRIYPLVTRNRRRKSGCLIRIWRCICGCGRW